MKTYLVVFTAFLLILSCKDAKRNSQIVSSDTNELINLQILIYPTRNPEGVQYLFQLINDSLTVVDYTGFDKEETSKSAKINSDQLKKIKTITDQIFYKKPTDQIITDVMDVKIILNDKNIYHQIGFGRGQSKNVDSLIDYLSELLDYQIVIYGFTELDSIKKMN